jgi:predicted PurR-regulated permease PerM
MGRGTRIEIPRWIQLVGLPLLLLLAWALAGALRHAVFVFLVAGLVALLLDPLVRGVERVPLGRFRIPRGLAVAVVYLGFAAAVALAIVGLATVVVDQTRAASDRVEAYLTEEHGRNGQTDAERDIDRLQTWLDTHRLQRVQIEEQADEFLSELNADDIRDYTTKALDVVEGAAISLVTLLFSLVLVVVISIYMLLDMPGFQRRVDRRFPPPAGSLPLTARVEAALVGYVKGQLLLSLIMGGSAGIGLWALGMLGLVPGADRYALVFGSWVGLMELLPYLGPWLGAIPPFVYALVLHPISSLWVAALFVAIHQVEGHVVVPNVMGYSLRLHPLLVIFGLLAGFEIYGVLGALVVLPLLAVGRALWEFFASRVELEPWGETTPAEEPVEQPPAAAVR